MEQQENPLKSILISRGIKADSSERYKKFNLSFNPFPRSGISDLNSSDYIISKLIPIDDEVKRGVDEFIVDSLFPTNPNTSDKYLSAVIRGEYGYGKTQTLLFAKFLIESFSKEKEFHKNPYVVYIDNPGAKLTELIGAIIAQIGEENFKRYLWNQVLEHLSTNSEIKKQLLSFVPRGYTLFDEDDIDPFSPVNTVNYKNFIDEWYKALKIDPKKRKGFQDTLKSFIISKLTTELGNSTVALFFYDLLSENIGINKTWEILTSGSAKELEKKEVYIIRAIVNILRSQGYTDFYILVDEFEAVTAGRLTPTEIDRYVTNLRALIDKERNWCSLFAMTGFALTRLKGVSPPLAERISGRIIELKALNNEKAKQLTINYLNLARDESTSISPFEDSAIESLRELSRGILRVYLKSSFNMLQRATEELNENQTINSEFVSKHFQIEEE
ncbi:MAG TPA: hypothetical protein VGM30_04835 [Puia sp.]|jgi:hypothetical protein